MIHSLHYLYQDCPKDDLTYTNLAPQRPSLKNVCGTIGKWKFSFSVCSTQFELSLIQKWSLVLFPLAHNLTSKTGIFFKPSNGQNGNFNNHKQLITQMIFMASCIEEIYSFKNVGQAGILNLCQTDFWAFSGYQLIVVCFGSPKVLRRQMLDIKCK